MISESLISPSPAWWAWLFWIAVAACAGGVLILLGLALEKYSSNSRLHTPKANCIEHWGEWFVMLGVFIEIVSTGVFAIRGEYENRQTREIEEKINPLNKPILSATADVRFIAKGDIFTSGPPPDAFENRSWIAFVNGTNSFSTNFALLAEAHEISVFNVVPINEHPDEKDILISFHQGDLFTRHMSNFPMSNPSNNIGTGLPAGFFNDVTGFIIEMPQMGTNVHILRGTVVLTINSSLGWQFPIPSEKQKYGVITCQIVTNANNQIEGKVFPITLHDWAYPPRFTNFFDGK